MSIICIVTQKNALKTRCSESVFFVKRRIRERKFTDRIL